MKPTLPFVLLLLATLGPAQDVEPTPERAVAAVVRELVNELPYRVQNGEALAIDADPSSDRGVVAAFTAKLLAEGFRIEAAHARGAGSIPVRVSTRESNGLGSIRVTAGDWVSERGFGRASWVDRPSEGTIVVSGRLNESRDATIASAREQLGRELRRRFPAIAKDSGFERYTKRQPTATFVAERTIAGRKHYEAFVMAEPTFERLQRAERAALRAERRLPWVRSAAVGVAGLVLWVLYVRADFRTRGFKTGRLRVLFGTLFAALSLGLWSVSL